VSRENDNVSVRERLSDEDDVRPKLTSEDSLAPTQLGVASRISVHNYLTYFRPLFHGDTAARVTSSDTFLTQAVQSHATMYDGAEHQQNMQHQHAEDEVRTAELFYTSAEIMHLTCTPSL
jgi:hypothetical protein